MTKRQIIAIGGGVLFPDTACLVEGYCLAAAQKERPRVLLVPTASGDETATVARFYETYSRFDCRPAHLPFFRRTPVDLRGLVLAQDVVHVSGGNTRSMLAVWRDWGLVEILREAWESGIVLCGSSAGSICWFEEGITDSLAGELGRLDCLGFLAGSNCPHYDGEKERRPTFQRLVGAGVVRDGLAGDDGVGLHLIGESLNAIVSSRPRAAAYRVERTAGTARETRL